MASEPEGTFDDPVKISLAGDPTRGPDNAKITLVEFSDFLIPKTTAEIFRRLMCAGMCPIITHPERNELLRGRLPELAA